MELERVESASAATAAAASYAAAEKISEISDQIFGLGFSVLNGYMQLLQKMANIYHWDMAKSGARSNEAQKMVGFLDADIASAQTGDKPSEQFVNNLNTLVHKYVSDRRFLQNDSYWYGDTWSNWALKHLHGLKSVVQNYGTNNSDQSSQDQAQTQRVMQTYNISISLVNSLQTLMGDMNKLISQSLRW